MLSSYITPVNVMTLGERETDNINQIMNIMWV